MEIKEDAIGEAVVLIPQTRVDSATAKAFEGKVVAVVNSGAPRIIIDFCDLDYI